jgi:hypothetical protein
MNTDKTMKITDQKLHEVAEAYRANYRRWFNLIPLALICCLGGITTVIRWHEANEWCICMYRRYTGKNPHPGL